MLMEIKINIFILDKDPVNAAQMQCDKHIVKMPLESAQMLSTAHRVLDGSVEKRPSKSGKRILDYWVHPEYDDTLYRVCHKNHPCTQWTMESKSNYDWHYMHFKALSVEYRKRYDRTHKSFATLWDILQDSPKNIPDIGPTPFRLAMGAAPQCINEDDPVASYRNFYKTKRESFDMTWKNVKTPEWFVE